MSNKGTTPAQANRDDGVATVHNSTRLTGHIHEEANRGRATQSRMTPSRRARRQSGRSSQRR